MSAEVEARRTAAAAVLADFRHELATAPLSQPPGREWMFRLADVLGSLLDAEAETGDVPDEDLADGTEPYCATCGAWVGLFVGLEGWHHFRGDPAPGGQRDLYDPGHPAAVGWTRPQILAPAEVSTVLAALADASEARRDWCGLPSDLARAGEYDTIAAILAAEVTQ